MTAFGPRQQKAGRAPSFRRAGVDRYPMPSATRPIDYIGSGYGLRWDRWTGQLVGDNRETIAERLRVFVQVNWCRPCFKNTQ